MTIKVNRFEYMLSKSLKDNISYRASRDIIENENGSKYSFPKSNGDTVNINNIFNEERFIKNYYMRLNIFFTKDRKTTGELIYFANISKEDNIIRKRILSIASINKTIFDNKTGSYKSILNKIKDDYEKIDTSHDFSREILSGKENSGGNYAILYKSNPCILTYERFTYSDFYIDNILQDKESLIINIKKKVNKMSCLDLIKTYSKNIEEDIVKIILDIIKKRG